MPAEWGLSSLSGVCGSGAGSKFKGGLFCRKSGWEASKKTGLLSGSGAGSLDKVAANLGL